ncbi:hypothetical protein, conserved [Trypanosoma brucei gambiense DAL972]|uniref:Ribosome control protein 1 domain-containing protein n=1 Tax=Trypanosoma brucei gambiense (strain MHOM/CI/86/DAL972) TaxID=679716 RepID=D0A9U7_TRYB9|nr:hypothetical protein, conserved [Trypanosoma brucei gambiense DAL972]CBH18448.1 hypothetical protein, conserved [Trypanosoma brucei gambiense DAL972]|eukprot:XP_011780712.1 hypothetical protein, conserved [Trypanosoma brucei gambiense DAL972]
MRFPSGSLAAYPLETYMVVPGERALEVSVCPTGSYAALLSGGHLHFLTCNTDVVVIGSVSICNAMGDKDYATHFLWHPLGEQLVVSTYHGRLLYFNVAIDVHRERCLTQVYRVNSLPIGCAASCVPLTNEVHLEGDAVVSLVSAGHHCFFACTATGLVRVLGWFKKNLLHTYDANFLSGGLHTFSGLDAACREHTSKDLCAGGTPITSIAILDICYSCQLELTGLLLSSGQFLLANSSAGDDFSCDNVVFNGVCVASVGTSRVCINPRHPLAVLATPTGELECKRISDDLSLTAFWIDVKCVTSDEYRGSIRCMVWTDDGEMLCVGYNQSGIMVLHYSGICVYSSHVAEYPRQHGLRPAIGIEGCASLSWCGNQLLIVDPPGLALTVLGFSKVVSSPCAEATAMFTPACTLDGSKLRFIEQQHTDGSLAFSDTVPLNPRYAVENNPITYGAISSDGSVVALAGRNGFLLFDRLARRWRTMRDRKEEREFTCVAQPVWVKDLMVVFPVRLERTHEYELRIYNRVLSKGAMLVCMPLQNKPLRLSECHDEDGDVFVHLFDDSGTLLVWRCVLSSTYPHAKHNLEVSLKLVKRVPLPRMFRNPVNMMAIHPARLSAYRTTSSPCKFRGNRDEALLPYVLFVVSGSNALIALDLNAVMNRVSVRVESEPLVPLTTIFPSGLFHLWVDYTAPLDGAVLLAVSDRGVSILHLSLDTSGGVTSSLCVNEYRVGDSTDPILAPVGLSAYDGCLLTAFADVDASQETLSSVSHFSVRTVVVPSMYNYRVLGEVIALRSKISSSITKGPIGGASVQSVSFLWDDRVLCWIEGMRRNSTLVCNADYLLCTLIDREASSLSDSEDPCSMLRLTLSLLQRYPEYHRIVVNCLRKLELPCCPVVVDNIGSTKKLFVSCLEESRLEEAAHLLHLIMVDDGEGGKNGSLDTLRQTLVCATRILMLAVSCKKVQLIYTLLPFMALIFKELLVSDDEERLRALFSDAKGQCALAGLRRSTANLSLLLDTEQDFTTLSSPWSFSYDTSEVGMKEIRSLTTFLVSGDSGLSEALEYVTTDCLRSGRLLTLYEIVRGFSLSPYGMMELKLDEVRDPHCGVSSHGEGSSVRGHFPHLPTHGELFLNLFTGIHEEFSLTRSPRCVGNELRRHRSSVVGAEVATTDFTLWTLAQSILYSTPGLPETLRHLRDHFAMWDECVLAINIILMCFTDVVHQLRRHSELVQALQHLLVDERNCGYKSFIRYCLENVS